MTLIIALLVAPLAFLTFCFGLELVVGLRPLPRWESLASGGSATIIVPAHDEAAILRERLISLNEAAGDRASVLLVADNCSDSTAEIAREVGVEVIERADPERRGKGFALDFAKRHLQRSPPEVVLIIDADCSTDSQSIALLADRCGEAQSPCQATNLQAPTDGSSPAVKISTFAFFIKNVIRQRALQRLSGRALLFGTGMALPWSLFAAADLASGNIVEDLKLAQDLAERGHPPIFVEGATIWSDAETEENTLSQRRRWEGGFLQNAFQFAPFMFGRSLRNGDLRGLWAAIDLMIPPFAMLVMLDLAALVSAGIVTWLVGLSWWPIILLGVALSLAGVLLGFAWAAGGSRFVSLKDLALAPLYVFWKLPMYLGFARHGVPKEWVRTGR